jgi:hypothetical protein
MLTPVDYPAFWANSRGYVSRDNDLTFLRMSYGQSGFDGRTALGRWLRYLSLILCGIEQVGLDFLDGA